MANLQPYLKLSLQYRPPNHKPFDAPFLLCFCFFLRTLRCSSWQTLTRCIVAQNWMLAHDSQTGMCDTHLFAHRSQFEWHSVMSDPFNHTRALWGRRKPYLLYIIVGSLPPLRWTLNTDAKVVMDCSSWCETACFWTASKTTSMFIKVIPKTCSFQHVYLHSLHTRHNSCEALASTIACHSQSVAFLWPNTPVQSCSVWLVWSCECVPGEGKASVDWALEDEFDVALLSSEPGAAEGAGGVEGMGAVGKGDLAPAHYSLFGAHVTTGAEGVSGGSSVQVQPSFTAQPQRHIRAHSPAHRALSFSSAGWCGSPWSGWAFLLAVAPVVVPVHVAAVHVDPGLLLVYNLPLGQTGEGQSVEAHGTLRTGRVELLPKRLQLFEGWGVA